MNQKNNTTSPVGKRLRFARTAKGLSQKQLGILAGIDEFSASPRINQYESGKHMPDYSTSKRLAKELTVSVTYLYADDDVLAELILLFSKADNHSKTRIMKEIRLLNKNS